MATEAVFSIEHNNHYNISVTSLFVQISVTPSSRSISIWRLAYSSVSCPFAFDWCCCWRSLSLLLIACLLLLLFLNLMTFQYAFSVVFFFSLFFFNLRRKLKIFRSFYQVFSISDDWSSIFLYDFILPYSYFFMN